MDQMIQGPAVDELHHEERGFVVVNEIIHRHDIRVIQSRRSFGFTQEPGAARIIRETDRRQRFEGYEPAQGDVFRFPDLTHASFANLSQNTIMTDSASSHDKGRA
jgi:hypothetical protein